MKKELAKKYQHEAQKLFEAEDIFRSNAILHEDVEEYIQPKQFTASPKLKKDYEKGDILSPEEIEYLKKLPKGYTYRSVREYEELILKIVNDIQQKYMGQDLTPEQLEYVQRRIGEIQTHLKNLSKEESLRNSILHWEVLKSATELYNYARNKNLENIKKKFQGPQKIKTGPKTNQMTISDYEKELDRRAGKKKKKGIDALIQKIHGAQKEDSPLKDQGLEDQDLGDEGLGDEIEKSSETDNIQLQASQKKSEEELKKTLQSLENFLHSVKDDLHENMYNAAIQAIRNAQKNPTEETVSAAKEMVQKALDET